MLRNILNFVAALIFGYLTAWALSNAITHYELVQAKNRWENVRWQQEDFEKIKRFL